MSQQPDRDATGQATDSREAKAALRGDRPLLAGSLFPWAVAACLTLVAAQMTALYLAARAESASISEQARLADMDMRSARNELEAERILAARELADMRVELSGTNGRIAELGRFIDAQGDPSRLRISTLVPASPDAPNARAVAVWDPLCQRGVIEESGLPAAPHDRAYRLWIVDPGYSSPVGAGVLAVDSADGTGRAAFKAERPVRTPSRFVVSIEPRGGSGEQQGPVVLIGR